MKREYTVSVRGKVPPKIVAIVSKLHADAVLSATTRKEKNVKVPRDPRPEIDQVPMISGCMAQLGEGSYLKNRTHVHPSASDFGLDQRKFAGSCNDDNGVGPSGYYAAVSSGEGASYDIVQPLDPTPSSESPNKRTAVHKSSSR